MSRSYEMSVEISEYRPERIAAIQEAAQQQWPFAEWDGAEMLWSSAEGSLCGGESDWEFAQRLAVALWKANGAYCEVTVRVVYLESLPCEEYGMDEKDYARLIQAEQPLEQTLQQPKEQTLEQHDANGSGR